MRTPARTRPAIPAQQTPGRRDTTPPADLGSLVTTPDSRRGTCARCASHRVTAIALTLTDGSPVDFVSCHACEHRTWTQDGAPLDLPTVLTKATKVKPA